MVEETLNFKYLKESGFSEVQAKAILQITRQKTEESIEKKAITKDYLDLKLENQKKTLIIWVLSMIKVILMLGFLSLSFCNPTDNPLRKKHCLLSPVFFL